MKKILTYFFVILGVIFFVILIGLGYIWFADPFNIRPMIDSFTGETPVTRSPEESDGAGNAVADKHPALSTEQEHALENIGINPETLPTTITPEMEACFTNILGSNRVEEIKGGATPTPVEVFKTRECY